LANNKSPPISEPSIIDEMKEIDKTLKEKPRHKIKPPIEDKETLHEETVKILEFLGRRHSEGDVKGDHLSKILNYLIEHQTEKYDKTLAKLSLLCGIGQRYVKENYLDGLEAFDIVEINFDTSGRNWHWKGLQ